ncbi:hypothetical protein RD110_20205 [Rhodoferax koreense]|uniref:YhaN AAA domain-containing protein n=1 Tax=Rhodoferax koreensis TaxID=1842727 RepID=A0A1P8JZR6_9BURK|nr:YhaN family protein [Rhodoferax koreense]APW39249.1 hypothetical protein RD110_20205 [Rhodoferax koreense]
MKIRKLFLQAFGPFTGRVLDFGATPARLHLVYGPNEAGKSSALRAIGDLRFGIPLRSADNFVHDNAQLLLAGVFEQADGTPLALARRKKNKDALTAADPLTGEPLLHSPANAAVVQALTGGLDRARFELGFGLDHARLREGGRQLVQGEGELGAALFEASAGLQGVKALLATLQEDAKAYYGPRSAQAVINDAARQLEEHKQALKKALVRPEAWRERQRALDAAGEQLQALQAEMAALRQRAATLTELRAVQPLLRQRDQALADSVQLGPVPALPADAREQRLAAQQTLATVQQQMAEAQAEIDACADAQAALRLEPGLTRHAAAVERLVQDFAAVRRQRPELLQTRAALQAGGQALAEQAAQIETGQGVAALLAVAPTAAERLALDELLADGARVAQALADAQARVARTAAQLQASLGVGDAATPVFASVVAALDAALQHAQAWSEGASRQTELQRDVDATARRLGQALHELGMPDAASLQTARPLLAGEIAQAEQAMAAREAEGLALVREDMQLQQDLQVHLRRQQQLAAVGELVTAQTLQAARERRHGLWREFKRLPGPSVDVDALAALAERFEQAQAEADRQADLLREGAERAAQAAECGLRIQENQAARQAHGLARADWQRRQDQAAMDWRARLVAAGLPAHDPAVLRDWQQRRAQALELAQQHADLQRESADLGEAVQAALSDLQAALRAAGQETPASPSLAALVQQARGWLQAQVETAARAEARAAQQQQWRAELAAAEADVAARQAEHAANAEARAGWTQRLRLAPHSTPAAVKARLAEFAGLAQAQAVLHQQQASIDRAQALEDALARDAAALATLLQEAAPSHLGDFIDQLQRRTAEASAGESRAAELERRAGAARRQFDQARRQGQAGAAVLQDLCAMAGVATVDELPQAELRAETGRRLQQDVTRLAAQLAAASARSVDALREVVADLDTAGTDAERARIEAALPLLQARIDEALANQLAARQAFEAIDTSGAAAEAREAMESAAARYRAAVRPWAQLKMAESLLQEALRRFRERAQGPMVTLASDYFALVTGGRYRRLRVDEAGDKPALQAVDAEGRAIGVEAMSEGTADQLYLALRLAALELQRSPERAMPLVLDDVLMTSDDERAAQMFKALARFAEGGQVLLFTHHRHLVPLARSVLPAEVLAVHALGP